MRILCLHQYFNTPAAPGGTQSYEMARRFAEAGYEVHVVTTRRGYTQEAEWVVTDEAGIPIHWLPVPSANTMGSVARIKAFLSWRM